MSAPAARVTSVRNERVQLVRRLVGDAAERRSTGLCVVEGVRIVSEYVRGAGPVSFALVSPRLDSLDGGDALRRILDQASSRHEWPVLETTDDVLAAASDTRAPQGVILVVPARRRPGIPPAAGSAVLVAWEIQDPGNAGSLIRTAEASGCTAAVLARAPGGAVADPFSPRALRAAAGSAFRLPVHEWCGPPADLAGALHDARYSVVACVPRGGATLADAPLAGACAILIGAETRGLPDEIRAAALEVSIPLEGASESLNAGAAAAVVAFEARRQRAARGQA